MQSLSRGWCDSKTGDERRAIMDALEADGQAQQDGRNKEVSQVADSINENAYIVRSKQRKSR